METTPVERSGPLAGSRVLDLIKVRDLTLSLVDRILFSDRRA